MLVGLIFCSTLLRQPYEIEREPVFENLDTDLGFLRCLNLCMRLVPFGLWYGAIPCCSFIFLSMATHQRTSENPWGAPQEFVYTSNCIASRYCLLALIAIIRGCVWCIENPLRTYVDLLPPVQLLLRPHFKPMLSKWFNPQSLKLVLFWNNGIYDLDPVPPN